MAFLQDRELFAVGMPAKPLQYPQGWKLRTSVYDYPAAIAPDLAEWIFDVHGVLHEVKSSFQASRLLTGRTLVASPPYGSEVVGVG